MIDVTDVTFAYSRKKPLFQQLGAQLSPGSIYGLLGRNGAGKTSLLKLLAGLRFPQAGQVEVFGQQPRFRRPSLLREIYVVPEEFHTPPVAAQEFVALYSPLYERFDHAALGAALAALELDATVRLTSMSYGQRKKFLLSFAMATGCRLLLLDEPTNGLDIPAKSQFRRLLAGAPADDRIIIVSTHQVRDLEHLIDPIIVLEGGEIVFQHSVAEVSSRLAAVTERELAANPDGYEVLHREDGLGGKRALVANRGGGDTAVDLELLFNSVISAPERIDSAFQEASHA